MYESRGPGGSPIPLQRVLNEAWPLRRKDGTPHAEGIPDRDPIPVRVRLVFEHDGESYLDGRAQRWTRTHVFVAVSDARIKIGAVWVQASDVRRR
ncbi:hypothetical protein QWY28_13140 [Nocardioides sp. SOB77]|uniref:Uncharacterized protein n=1 Tax=Nocardioides oceani TaxID=3058369 RepID=A0ABT8FGT8_9ACTN|nr:hypothetical protein [Nocardioides oceani]MDN4173899.1 hypothetical protein [Nocardioides oceani]